MVLKSDDRWNIISTKGGFQLLQNKKLKDWEIIINVDNGEVVVAIAITGFKELNDRDLLPNSLSESTKSKLKVWRKV